MTSLTATAVRLTEPSSYNAMRTCDEPGRRKWFFCGPDIPTILWPYEQLSTFTKASGLSRIGAQATANVSADVWVNHPESWRYTVKEDSIVMGPGMVLSLVGRQNEQQILDLDEENEDA